MWQKCTNGPFYWYGGNIEFNRFKEYYGMPRGALPQYLRGLFERKENFGEKAIIITSKHGTTTFFPITIFF